MGVNKYERSPALPVESPAQGDLLPVGPGQLHLAHGGRAGGHVQQQVVASLAGRGQGQRQCGEQGGGAPGGGNVGASCGEVNISLLKLQQ